MTGRENTRFVSRIHGVRDTRTIEEWVKDFSEIGQHFELPIKAYSSGMKSKFSFAVSMAFDFDIYLTDEITSVGMPASNKNVLTYLRKNVRPPA